MEQNPSIDVGEDNFDKEVIERSHTVPVVVDFWAAWCGPCRALGPVLERLVAEDFAGQLVLAKVNTEDHPELSASHDIRSIPAVKIFRGGQVVSEFVGALPEAQLRQILAAAIPTEADQLVEQALEHEASGNREGAEEHARAALALEHRHAPASLVLARLLRANGAFDEALALLATVTGPLEPEATALSARLTLERDARAAGDPQELERRLAADDGDVAARFAVGLFQAARGDYRTGLDNLLEVVRRDRKFGDDAARRAMLTIFTIAGNDSELVRDFRSKLARVLY